MPAPPQHPKIYHITHVDNLPDIIDAGKLISLARMNKLGGPATAIGQPGIKENRLKLPVHCHKGDHVGDYVPFYFCPRSVMLFKINKATDPTLPYQGRQKLIVHLEADLNKVVDWAHDKKRRWAFSLTNAGSRYAEFRDDLANLNEINWPSVSATYWAVPPEVREHKQAEFLLYGSFPWRLVERIGVHSMPAGQRVTAAIAAADHRPEVNIMREWYYPDEAS